MKKIIKLSLTAVLAIVASVACTREPFNSQPEVKKDGYRVIKLLSETTKTTLDENNQPLWAEGDIIAVYNQGKAEDVTVKDSEDGYYYIEVNEEYGTGFKAVYPAAALISNDWDSPSRIIGEGSDTTFLASVNIYDSIDGKFGKANIAVGKNYLPDDITLKNAVAILKVTGLPDAGTLSLSKYSTALVDVYYDTVQDTLIPIATEKGELTDSQFKPTVSFTVAATDGASGEPTVYYIPVFPETNTRDLELTWTPGSGNPQVMYLKDSVVLKRNTIYSVSWRKPSTFTTFEALNDSLTRVTVTQDVPVDVAMTLNEGQGSANIIFPDEVDSAVVNLVLNGTTSETITVKNDENADGPAILYITAPTGTKICFETPQSHVVLNGVKYTDVTGEFSATTLVINEGVEVESLTLIGGGLEVHGTLGSVTIPEDHNPIVVRDCEGLSGTVYNNLKAFIDPAYTTKDNKDGTYDIVKADADAVVMIGETKYETLAAAIGEVKSGDVIKVYKDIDNATGIKVASGKNFTVDFGGHTYTVNKPGAGSTNTQTQAFQLLQSSTITFKNGTICCAEENKDLTWAKNATEKGIALMIQNYCTLTLDNMTIDATNIAQVGSDGTPQARYAVSTNHGMTEFKGNTTIITVGDDIAFDSCDGSETNYPGKPTVIWNSTGTFNDSFELSGGNFTVKQPIALKKPIRTGAQKFTLKVDAAITPAEDWSGGDALVIVNRRGDLTICGTGKIDGGSTVMCAVKMTEKDDAGTDIAKLTVNEKVALIGYNYGISGNGNRQGTEITINGGTIKGVATNDCAGIYHPQNGTLSINGGTIEGATGIFVKAGNVTTTVNAGTIRGIGAKANYVSAGKFTSTGDAFALDNCDYPGGVPNAEIKGGTFISDNGDAVASYAKEGLDPITGFIKGGTFSDESALKYAADGATITIAYQSNHTASGIFIGKDQNKTITFDLGGHILTFDSPAVGSTGTENQAFHIEKGNGAFTLKNGTVQINPDVKDEFRFVIQNYNDLILDSVKVDGTGLSYNNDGKGYTYALSNNCGNVELKGKTSIIASTESGLNNYAFDVCKSGSYEAPKVTWNSTGSVTGGIELTGGEFVVATDLALTQPIRTKKAAAKLTVNASITPVAGWTKDNGDALVIVKRMGNLTIAGTNGTISYNGNTAVYCAVKMTESDDASDTENRAGLTVENGVTLEGYQAGISGNGNKGRDKTDVIINGGTIKGCATSGDECCGIFQPQAGTLNINGGYIEGLVGVYVKSGSVTTSVAGGQIKGTGAKGYYSTTYNGFKVTGDAIVFDNCAYPGGKPNAEINGGTFISDNGDAVASYAKDGLDSITGFIKGGTFSSDPSKHVAAGYKAKQENEMWTVVSEQTD